MTTPAQPIQADVKTEKKPDGSKRQFVEIGPSDLDNLHGVTTDKLATTFGVDKLDLEHIVGALKPKIRDPEIDTEAADVPKKAAGTVPQAKATVHTHRYTIVVPDEAESSILNLGHGDTKRELPDPGISARTQSHIHLHTLAEAEASMVALGGSTKVKLGKLEDPKSVLSKNSGIGAVTNGNAWIDAKKRLNLAAHEGQAVLRSHKANVRVQADDACVELAAGSSIALGAKGTVAILAEDGIAPGDNAYDAPFDGKLVADAASYASKQIVQVGDIATAAVSLVQGFKSTYREFKKEETAAKQAKTDLAKAITDTLKFASQIGRFIATTWGDVGGQVKIGADTFASMSGGVAASVFGRLSASMTSALSASVVGGTASLKGLAWASVWGGLGASVRTLRGKASLQSDYGSVAVSGETGVFISSPECVSIGSTGDAGAAELKGTFGSSVWGGTVARVACGEGDAMALELTPRGAYLGDATTSGKVKPKLPEQTCLKINASKKAIGMQAPGAFLRVLNGEGSGMIVGNAKQIVLNAEEEVCIEGPKGIFIG